MPPTTRRTRTISLRLSEQEFAALKSLYAIHGARSISDFARTALQSLLAGTANDQFALEMKIKQYDRKIESLTAALARISALVEKDGNEHRDGSEVPIS
jgi:hypothetical protein